MPLLLETTDHLLVAPVLVLPIIMVVAVVAVVEEVDMVEVVVALLAALLADKMTDEEEVAAEVEVCQEAVAVHLDHVLAAAHLANLAIFLLLVLVLGLVPALLLAREDNVKIESTERQTCIYGNTVLDCFLSRHLLHRFIVNASMHDFQIMIFYT